MQRSNNYATNQVKFFLSELRSGNHNAKLKAIQRLQGYFERYQPEIYDDTVHFLFTGEDEIAGNNVPGLLHFCGIESEKQPGQLKRTSGPLLSFVRWLLHQTDDIYLNNFVRLSPEELVKINFPKHILNQNESSKLGITIGRQSRGGHADDAFELLHILYQDHRNAEDEQDPIDINFLLHNDSVCYDRFHAWLQKSNLDFLEEELANRVRQPRIKVVPRPSRWDDVVFKTIPLQEGEDVGTADVEDGPSAPPPIPDPLSLRDVDLRETQEIYATGGLQKRMMAARRATEFGGRTKTSTNLRESLAGSVILDDDEDDGDGDDEAMHVNSNFGSASEARRGIQSVIPSDKAFSIPLFLSLVHGGTTFGELGTGLSNLRSHLLEQSTRRVNLVRNHFGLFSQCAEGLEWLKEYRKGNLRVEELPGKERNYRKEREAMRRASATGSAKPQIVKGMEELRRAQGTLELAKVEAKNTLAPILERMKKTREVKSAEKVLKGMSTLLDYPRSMKSAFERGELKDVVALYQRVIGIPETTGLKITTKIKRAAEAVIFELKKTSLTVALSPNTNPAIILRHAQIILDLEGGTSYLKILRLSFLRQAAEFLKAFKDIRERMIADGIDAFDKGQELNIAAKNDMIVNDDDNTDLYVLARKYYYGAAVRPRPTRSGSTRDSTSLSLNAGASSSNRPRLISTASSSSVTSKKRGSFIAIDPNISLSADEYVETMTTVGGGGINDGAADDSSPHFGSLQEWIEGAHAAFSLDDMIAEYDAQMLDESSQRLMMKDFSELFCHIVRKSFSAKIIDLVARWFPCLFRLSSEIITFNNTDKSSMQGFGGSKGMSAFTSTFTKMSTMKSNLGLISTSRLLGSLMTLTVDHLQQSILGMRSTLLTAPMPQEIVLAVTELDNDLSSLQSSYGLQLMTSGAASSLVFHQASGSLSEDSRFLDIVHTPSMQAPIKQQHDALLDVFSLHEALEVAFKTAVTKLQASMGQTNGSGSNNSNAYNARGTPGVKSNDTGTAGGTFRPFPSNFTPNLYGNKYATQLQNAVYELDVTSAQSPYFESFRMLSALARESERSVAKRVLERLIDRTGDASEALLFETDTERLFNFPLYSSPFACVLVPESVGVESAVQEFEAMSVRGLEALGSIIRRPDWTAHQVYDSVLHKALTAFLEKLRRKVMLIEELRANTVSANTNSASGNNSPSRRAPRRNSLTQDNLVLSTLEEDLRMTEVGWERDYSSFRTTKNAAWLDFLRGLIRLRSVTLPRVLRKAMRVFSFDDATNQLNTVGLLAGTLIGNGNGDANVPPPPPAHASPPAKTGTESILNRLFASETVVESHAQQQASKDQSKDTQNKGSGEGKKVRSLLGSSGGAHGQSTLAMVSKATLSLKDRILMDWVDEFRDFGDVSTSLGQFVRPYLQDMVGMEVDVVEQYLQHRIKGIKSIVFSSYSYLVEQELQQRLGGLSSSSSFAPQSSSRVGQLPAYLSRIILALHEEKRTLQQMLGGLSLDNVVNRKLFRQAKQRTRQQYLQQVGGGSMPSAGAPGFSDTDEDAHEHDQGSGNNHGGLGEDEHAVDDDDFFGITNNRMQFGSVSGGLAGKRDRKRAQAAASAHRYAMYLYQQLSKHLLEVYDDLLKRLFSGSFGVILSTADATASAPAHAANSGGANGAPENPFKSSNKSTTSSVSSSSAPEGAVTTSGVISIIPANSGTKLPTSALPTRTILQAVEEYEFLKTVLRPILVDLQVLQKMSLTPSDLQALSGAVQRTSAGAITSREDLLQSSQLLVIMLQQG